MLVSYNWLKEYVDIEPSAEELAEIITRAGVEIAGVEPTNKGVKGVVVAKVLTCEDHPNSDHLHCCTVTTDGENVIKVVCGAPNVAAGQKVMFAQVGATLPGDVVITATKLRGEESNGMICSMQEIGVDEDLVAPADKDGIRVLPEDAPLGADVMELPGHERLGPRRGPDAKPLRLPERLQHCPRSRCAPEKTGASDRGDHRRRRDQWQNEGHDPGTRALPPLHRHDGHRREGWPLADLDGAPSACAGMRPISNLVDITNYVMMELGQPLHAYDYTTLAGRRSSCARRKPASTSPPSTARTAPSPMRCC